MVVLFFGRGPRCRPTSAPASATSCGSCRSVVAPRARHRARWSAPGMAIAAFTPRRAYATAAIIAVFIVRRASSPGRHRAWSSGVLRDFGSCCSTRSIWLDGTNAWLFGGDRRAPCFAGLPLGGLSCASSVLRRRRGRRLRRRSAHRRADASSRADRRIGATGRVDRPRRASRAGTATSSRSTTSASRRARASPACSARTVPARRRSCTWSPGCLAPSSGSVTVGGQPAWRNPAIYRSDRPRPGARGGLPVPDRPRVRRALGARLQGLAGSGRRDRAGDRDGRPRPTPPTAPIGRLLEGHAAAGQGRGRARPRAADPAPRRAVQRHGPAPAAAHDGPAPAMAADGRTILFSLAHPRGGRAAGRAGARDRRRPAGRVGRLPRDPPPHDRSAAHVHDPLLRRPRASPRRSSAEPAVAASTLDDGLLTVRASDFGAFSRLVAGVARDGERPPLRGAADRRVARERLRLPGALDERRWSRISRCGSS